MDGMEDRRRLGEGQYQLRKFHGYRVEQRVCRDDKLQYLDQRRAGDGGFAQEAGLRRPSAGLAQTACRPNPSLIASKVKQSTRSAQPYQWIASSP
jgi:hypothetical protein